MVDTVNTRRSDLTQPVMADGNNSDVQQEGFRPYTECPCGRKFQDFMQKFGYIYIAENDFADICPTCGRGRESRKPISIARQYVMVKSRSIFFGLPRSKKQLLPMDQSVVVDR